MCLKIDVKINLRENQMEDWNNENAKDQKIEVWRKNYWPFVFSFFYFRGASGLDNKGLFGSRLDL